MLLIALNCKAVAMNDSGAFTERGKEARAQDSSRPEFWDVRYETGQTPWDFHGVPAAESCSRRLAAINSATVTKPQDNSIYLGKKGGGEGS